MRRLIPNKYPEGLILLKNNWVPLALLIVSSCIELWGGGTNLLRYERDGILKGELWRIFTAHLVHGTPEHWLLNAAGLILIWAIYPAYFRQPLTPLLIIGIALLTSAALLVWNPDVVWYLGMSALLHGMFAAWSLADLLAGRHIAAIPLALITMKVLYEQYAGATPGVIATIGLPVLVDTHLYGVVAGVGMGALCARLMK